MLLVRTIPVSVMPYRSSNLWPVICSQRDMMGLVRGAEPLTISLVYQKYIQYTRHSKKSGVPKIHTVHKTLKKVWCTKNTYSTRHSKKSGVPKIHTVHKTLKKVWCTKNTYSTRHSKKSGVPKIHTVQDTHQKSGVPKIHIAHS